MTASASRFGYGFRGVTCGVVRGGLVPVFRVGCALVATYFTVEVTMFSFNSATLFVVIFVVFGFNVVVPDFFFGVVVLCVFCDCKNV